MLTPLRPGSPLFKRGSAMGAGQTLLERADAPQHFMPPSPRELRAQAVQRLQVGLFGLAMMLLLVALANIIMEHARLSDSGLASSSAHSVSSSGGAADPLADAGVVPGGDSGGKHAGAASARANGSH